MYCTCMTLKKVSGYKFGYGYKAASVTAALLVLGACTNAGKIDDAVSAPPGATLCPSPDSADATAITQERANLLIGLTELDAQSCASSLSWVFRVGERDGESFAVTKDYSQQRVTISITKDQVTAVSVG